MQFLKITSANIMPTNFAAYLLWMLAIGALGCYAYVPVYGTWQDELQFAEDKASFDMAPQLQEFGKYAGYFINRDEINIMAVPVQRRVSNEVSFARPFRDYALGFGNSASESSNFWIGLKALNPLTEKYKYNKIAFGMEKHDDNDKKRYFAYYNNFSVSNAHGGYSAHFSSFDSENSDAGDSIILDAANKKHSNNDMMFSAKNSMNDDSCSKCEKMGNGGWWYNSGSYSNPNGVYHTESHKGNPEENIFWKSLNGYKPLSYMEITLIIYDK